MAILLHFNFKFYFKELFIKIIENVVSFLVFKSIMTMKCIIKD